MPRIFAIGDIHGCFETFRSLLLEKINIQLDDQVYCIGDYVDRGPNSKGVIDLIIDLRNKGYRIHTLKGNHEQMMLDAALGKEKLHHWLLNGGEETLQSFDISTIQQLPDKYRLFIERTRLYIKTRKYVFVHAGLNFTSEDPFADTTAMLWTRDGYFDPAKIDNRLLIHGHTPISQPVIMSQDHLSRVNIDAGCVYKNIPGLGYLAALSLPDRTFLQAENIDDY